MLVVFIRTLVLFSLVVVVMRVMGKRQVGQLQPFELVVMIMISELAALPMADTGIPLIYGVIPILTLLVAGVFLAYISLKSERARGIICGTPSILVENGKILEKELHKLRYNINDLLEQLRAKNFPNLGDIEFAILETSGQLSVIPKSQKRPVNPEDLQIPTKYEGLPLTLVVDGKVLHKNLAKANLDEDWLKTELARFGINRVDRLLFASLDTQGQLLFQPKSA
ncbi:MAG: YetF domain-containing protein [Bacillota bacterium]